MFDCWKAFMPIDLTTPFTVDLEPGAWLTEGAFALCVVLEPIEPVVAWLLTKPRSNSVCDLSTLYDL